MSPVRALSACVLVVLAASVGPGLAGASVAGDHASGGNTPTTPATNETPSGGTDVTNGTAPVEGNTTTDGNSSANGDTTTGGNTSTRGNATADGNTTARGQSFEPGPVRRPEHRQRGPRVVPDVVVDDDGKAHYRTLSAAVENARENETILVRPGTYDGGVRVEVDGLTVAGFGPEATQLAGRGTGTAVVVAASDVTVRAVGVHGYETGIAVEAGAGETTANVELSNLTIERVSGAGVRIETDGPAARVSNVTVESSELRLGGVVGWSGGNASSGGDGSKVGEEGNGSAAGKTGNGSATADNASSADDGSEAGSEDDGSVTGREDGASAAGSADDASTSGIPVDDGPVTGVAVESRAGSVADVRVEDVTVSDLGTGLRLAGPNGSVSGVRVVGGDFSGNDRGIDVADGAVRSVEVGGADLVGNGVGLLVREPADASALSLRGNRFADNDVGLWSRAAGTLDAEGNAWGAPSGPDAAGNPTGTGDVVRGAVDVDPWLPPVLRLADAAASSGRLTVELVAHAERVAGYEVAVGYDADRVDDVAVEGGAMPASLEVDGDALVVSGSAASAAAGPVVLARVEFEGDLEAVADSLELRGERSVAYDGTGRVLEAAFLTGDLSVDVADGEGESDPAGTPTEVPGTETTTEVPTTGTPTEVPTTETPTELPPTPNGTERATDEGTPPAADGGTSEQTVASGAAGDTARPQSASGAPQGAIERSTDEPDPLGLESIKRRLTVVGDTLSKLGAFLRSLVG